LLVATRSDSGGQLDAKQRIDLSADDLERNFRGGEGRRSDLVEEDLGLVEVKTDVG